MRVRGAGWGGIFFPFVALLFSTHICSRVAHLLPPLHAPHTSGSSVEPPGHATGSGHPDTGGGCSCRSLLSSPAPLGRAQGSPPWRPPSSSPSPSWPASSPPIPRSPAAWRRRQGGGRREDERGGVGGGRGGGHGSTLQGDLKGVNNYPRVTEGMATSSNALPLFHTFPSPT